MNSIPETTSRYDVAFAIGWDYAAYGMHLPAEAVEQPIINGYKAAEHHFGRRRPPRHDQYVRKWLQLRCNAWRRHKAFNPGVTPAYLQAITPTYCPITQERLTVAAGEPTDWSVDRVLNDAGYAPGNLVVLSTRANKAKGDLTYRDILNVVASGKPMNGLSTLEWARLASMVGMLSDCLSLLPMLVVPPPNLLVCNDYTMIQFGIMHVAARITNPRIETELRQACHGKQSKAAFTAFVRAAAWQMRHLAGGKIDREEVYHAMGNAWRDQSLLKLMRQWINVTTTADLDACYAIVKRQIVVIRKAPADVRDAWSVSTGGHALYEGEPERRAQSRPPVRPTARPVASAAA